MDRIIFILVCMTIFDLIPALFISGLIRFILKRKISKGWCISVFVLTTITSFILTKLSFGEPVKLGFLDFMIHFIVIKKILYDKDADSFLDTEEEIKRKQKLNEKIHS